MKINLRKYGTPPFNIAVIHGGPGAAGEMAPVAKTLSHKYGVLEPIQTQTSLTGQIEELKKTISNNCSSPINLIGHSWGAWLGFMLTAKYPTLVKKLILVGSGPFEEKYAKNLLEKRLKRLIPKDSQEVRSLLSNIDDSSFARLGALIDKADSYDPITHEDEIISYSAEIFQKVWKDAATLRSNGKLLDMSQEIQCPVTAIHGDYDPHPLEGVSKPLESRLSDFKFIKLNHCGHTPWIERLAKEEFYSILERELIP